MPQLNIHFILTGLVALFAWGASTVQAAPIQPLAHWKFEETDFNDPALDSVGGIHGTYTGSADPNVSGAPNFGSGVSFDIPAGVGSVALPNNTALNTLTNDFTVMSWINIPSKDVTRRIISANNDGPNSWGFGLWNNNGLRFTTYGVQDYNILTDIPLNTWTHVAAVMDSSNDVSFYVNGGLVGTVAGSNPGIANSTPTFSIGRRVGVAQQFKGLVDEVAVFNVALQPAQISNFMQFGTTVPEPSTYALAILGALGVAVCVWRRRGRAAA